MKSITEVTLSSSDEEEKPEFQIVGHIVSVSPFIDQKDLPFYMELLADINKKVDKRIAKEQTYKKNRKRRVKQIVAIKGEPESPKEKNADGAAQDNEVTATKASATASPGLASAYPIVDTLITADPLSEDDEDVKPLLCVNTGFSPDHGIKLPECKICKLLFPSHECYKDHFDRTHKEDLPFACSQCPKLFRTDLMLRQHLRNHGEKKYECPECEKAFVFRATLARHLRTHSGEKPFVCVICSRSFSQQGHLNSHMVTHKVERTEECITCGAKFFRRDVLLKHCRTQGHIC